MIPPIIHDSSEGEQWGPYNSPRYIVYIKIPWKPMKTSISQGLFPIWHPMMALTSSNVDRSTKARAPVGQKPGSIYIGALKSFVTYNGIIWNHIYDIPFMAIFII